MASIQHRADRPLPWQVQWTDPATKKQCWKSFPRKTGQGGAEEFRDRLNEAIRGGTYVSPKPIPFSDYALDWLARKAPTVTPNAHGVHRWAVQGHLVPALGALPLQSLRADRIERLQADLLTSEKKLGPRSVQIVMQVLSNILRDARRKGFLAADPTESIDRVKVPRRDLHFLTVEQIGALCKKAGPFYGTLFAVQAICGLRSGELLALRWKDLDLDTGRLTVSRQVIWIRKCDRAEGEAPYRFTPPKSQAGNRTVEIPAPLLVGLQQYRAWRNGSVQGDALVFSTESGTPLMQRNVRRRHFAPALKALGLSGIRPHDFRRSFVAIHVAAGTHPKLVQTRIGHSNISLTMDTYGRLAGDIPLSSEQAARIDSKVALALNPAQFQPKGQPEPIQNGQEWTESRTSKPLDIPG